MTLLSCDDSVCEQAKEIADVGGSEHTGLVKAENCFRSWVAHDRLTGENLPIVLAKLVPVARTNQSAHPHSYARLAQLQANAMQLHLPAFLYLLIAGRVEHASSFKQPTLAWEFQSVQQLII